MQANTNKKRSKQTLGNNRNSSQILRNCRGKVNPRQFTDTCLASSQKLQGEAKPRPFTETCSVCSLKLQGRGEADAFLSTFWEAIGTTGSKQKHSKSQLVFIDPCLVSVFGKLSYFQRASRSHAKTGLSYFPFFDNVFLNGF